jgi:hypothetical protein
MLFAAAPSARVAGVRHCGVSVAVSVGCWRPGGGGWAVVLVCASKSLEGKGRSCCRRAGVSALYVAWAIGHLEAARVMLEAGARTDVGTSSDKRPVDVVRPPLGRPLRLCDRVTLLHCSVVPCAGVQRMLATDGMRPPLAALLAAAAPWSSRRPVAVACGGGVWQ